MKDQGLTHKIIGAAMEVHRHLGNGFQEVVYQRALAIEMQLQDIPFVREYEMSLRYKDQHITSSTFPWINILAQGGWIFL